MNSVNYIYVVVNYYLPLDNVSSVIIHMIFFLSHDTYVCCVYKFICIFKSHPCNINITHYYQLHPCSPYSHVNCNKVVEYHCLQMHVHHHMIGKTNKWLWSASFLTSQKSTYNLQFTDSWSCGLMWLVLGLPFNQHNLQPISCMWIDETTNHPSRHWIHIWFCPTSCWMHSLSHPFTLTVTTLRGGTWTSKWQIYGW
jgi:hypothetical protein